MENETQTPEESAVRICKRPGCTTPLHATNKSGKCAKHFHWNETAKPRPSSGNVHVLSRANGTNGHAVTTGTEDKPRLDGIRNLIESRVDRFLTSLPIAEKTKLAAAWLSGEI